jgi:DNA-binding helix-hairpin-helix protein with protein kinase domain
MQVVTSSGVRGALVAAFADGVWARKFLECPWCDRTTWEVRIEGADLSDDSGPQYLIEDVANSLWHMVDASRVRPVQDKIGGALFKVGGTS